MKELSKPVQVRAPARIKKLIEKIKKTRAEIRKASKGPAPQKAIPRPGPNEPCPCGRKKEDGRPLKFKRCCGSTAGDLHYFVVDVEPQEPLTNDEGQVLIFRDHATAAAAARAKGWFRKGQEIEIIPLNPEKWEKFKAQVPYVMVTTKEFDVGDKVEIPEKEPPHESPCAECEAPPPCEQCEFSPTRSQASHEA